MISFVRILSIIVVAGGLLMSSCGHDAPQESSLTTNGGQTGGDTTPSQGDGHRPGLGELNDFDKELADDVLRVKGPDMNLRYDRAGILVVKDRNGCVRITDLDGADVISLTPGMERPDSVMTDAVLTVNDSTVGLREMKKMRRTDGRIWYKATDSAGDIWVIVVPD